MSLTDLYSYVVYAVMAFIGLLGASGGVKLLDIAIAAFKSWYAKRKEKNLNQTADARELAKFRTLQGIDVTEISRKDFQAIKDACMELAEVERARARTAEAANLQLQSRFDDLHLKYETLETRLDEFAQESKSDSVIREQLERNFRLLYDTLGIAYWEIFPDGKVCGNATFFKLVGMHVSRCHHGGWFEAIEESARAGCQAGWDAFVESYQTRPALRFKFKNVVTGKIIETVVYCDAIMKNVTDVYKFTAQTSTLTEKFATTEAP